MAMSVFVKKHYGGGKAGIFIFLIYMAIWVRAAMAAVGRFIRFVGLPILDAGLILLSFWIMKNIWNDYVRTDVDYKNKLLWIAFPVFTFVYLIAAYYAGLYDRWYKRSGLVRSTLIATIILLAGYSLLPEEYRFSRAIILFGAILAFIFISILRWLLVSARVLNNNKQTQEHPNTLVVGSPAEYEKVIQLMKEANLQEQVLGRVEVNEEDHSGIGNWKKLSQLSLSIPFREVIYCEGILSFADIIESVRQLPGHARIKFHAQHSQSIISSDSKDSLGETLSYEKKYNLSDPYLLRLKRFVDVSVSVFAIITFPVHLILIKKPGMFFLNCFAVLFAQKTWIGYATAEKNLPPLRKAIIACNGIPTTTKQPLPAESLLMADQWYARDYDPVMDLRLIRKTYRQLGG
jgi:hypothetical protein